MLSHMPTSRFDVARRTYEIVAAFAEGTDERTIAERTAAWSAEDFEAAVATLAIHAECNTVQVWNGEHRRTGWIVMEALDAEELADDYMRMKRGEQAMAFDADQC